jgi:hypothetical protein
MTAQQGSDVIFRCLCGKSGLTPLGIPRPDVRSAPRIEDTLKGVPIDDARFGAKAFGTEDNEGPVAPRVYPERRKAESQVVEQAGPLRCGVVSGPRRTAVRALRRRT